MHACKSELPTADVPILSRLHVPHRCVEVLSKDASDTSQKFGSAGLKPAEVRKIRPKQTARQPSTSDERLDRESGSSSTSPTRVQKKHPLKDPACERVFKAAGMGPAQRQVLEEGRRRLKAQPKSLKPKAKAGFGVCRGGGRSLAPPATRLGHFEGVRSLGASARKRSSEVQSKRAF